MPRCQGLPTGPCPNNTIDPISVKNTQGDLFLCQSCEAVRFPPVSTSANKSSPTSNTSENKASTAPTSSTSVTMSTSVNKVSAPSANRVATTKSTSTVDSLQVSNNVNNEASKSLTDSGTSSKLVQCELLYFVNGSYDYHPLSAIKSTLAEFYRDDEILMGKQVLAQSVDGIDGVQQFCKNRIGVNKVKASIDDIMNIFKVVDESCCRDNLPTFCAAKKDRVPILTDDLSDIAAIRLELTQLRQQLNSLTKQLSTSNQCKCTNPNAKVSDPVASSVISRADVNNTSTDMMACSDSAISLVTSHPVDDSSNMADHCVTDEANTTRKENKQTFVSTLKQNIEKFQQVSYKKKKKSPVVGHSAAESQPFKGVYKKSVVCINRLHPETTETMVSDFLSSHGVNVLSCFRYENTDNRYVLMRVCVPQPHASKLYNADIWPLGVVVRPWKFKSHDVTQEDGAAQTN